MKKFFSSTTQEIVVTKTKNYLKLPPKSDVYNDLK